MKVKPIGVTLIELLIASMLIVVIIFVLHSVASFSQFHMLTSKRRAVVQNEVSYIMDHMHKNISRAIGDATDVANFPLQLNCQGIFAPQTTGFWIDGDGDGKLTKSYGCNQPTTHDHIISYIWSPSGPVSFWWYRLIFYSGEDAFGSCCDAGEELSKRIINFQITPSSWRNIAKPYPNYVDVTITACWQPEDYLNAGDPASGTTCGTPDNPTVTMTSRIYMPQVSTN